MVAAALAAAVAVCVVVAAAGAGAGGGAGSTHLSKGRGRGQPVSEATHERVVVAQPPPFCREGRQGCVHRATLEQRDHAKEWFG